MAKKHTSRGGTPGHVAGKYTGYTLRDSRYYVAPTHRSAFDRLHDRYAAAETLVRHFNAFLTHHYEQLEGDRRRHWEYVREDLGLDAGDWRYDAADGCVYRAEKQAEKKEE